MQELERKKVKALIELSNTVEEADYIIEKYVKVKTVKEKIAFLKGMFDGEIVNQESNYSEDIIYKALLLSIICTDYL